MTKTLVACYGLSICVANHGRLPVDQTWGQSISDIHVPTIKYPREIEDLHPFANACTDIKPPITLGCIYV